MLHIPEGGLKIEREFTLSIDLGEPFNGMAQYVLDSMSPSAKQVLRLGSQDFRLYNLHNWNDYIGRPDLFPTLDTVKPKDWLALVCQRIRWYPLAGMTPIRHEHNIEECLVPTLPLAEPEEVAYRHAFQNLYGEIRLHWPYRKFLKEQSMSDVFKFIMAHALVDAIGCLTLVVSPFVDWDGYLQFLQHHEDAAEKVEILLADPHYTERTGYKWRPVSSVGDFWPEDLAQQWTEAVRQFDPRWLSLCGAELGCSQQ